MLAQRQLPWRQRLQRLGAGALTSLAVLMPWVGYNLSRFEHPVFLSSQLEPTLVGSNCRDTYQGPQLGYITVTCLDGYRIFGDQSASCADGEPRRPPSTEL